MNTKLASGKGARTGRYCDPEAPVILNAPEASARSLHAALARSISVSKYSVVKRCVLEGCGLRGTYIPRKTSRLRQHAAAYIPEDDGTCKAHSTSDNPLHHKS